MLKSLSNKFILSIVVLFGIMFSGFGYCLPTSRGYGNLQQDFPYPSESIDVINCDGSTDIGNCTSIKKDENLSQKTILRRLLGVFGLDTSEERDLKFIDYLKSIINMALGLIAFIALIMTIYTFYMIIFSKDDEGTKKAKGNLFGIFVALAIIGLAWLIISFIFRWYQSNRKDKEEKIQTGDISNVGEFY